MNSPFPAAPEPVATAGGHTGQDLLARYASGTLEGAAAWLVEAHLTACAACRSVLSAQVDGGRLARNRSVMLVRAAVPEGGLMRRFLRRCRIPDHVLGLLAATPSLRRSWLLAVVGVLAVVTGEAVLVREVWSGSAALADVRRHAGSDVLAPFLLVAPLLVLAGVAAAFVPSFDPASRLTVAAPFSGFTLLLVRTVSALAAALVPVVCAAFVVPGPGWLPAALLLPSLALCAFALAAATVVGPAAAAATSAGLWVLAVLVLVLAMSHSPLVILQWHGQFVSAAVLLAGAAALLLRHDRIDFGWTR